MNTHTNVEFYMYSPTCAHFVHEYIHIRPCCLVCFLCFLIHSHTHSLSFTAAHARAHTHHLLHSLHPRRLEGESQGELTNLPISLFQSFNGANSIKESFSITSIKMHHSSRNGCARDLCISFKMETTLRESA